MVCQSCVDKYVQYYMRKGLSRGQAERMALRLVQRVEKRRRREHWDARIYNVKMVLFKLALLTNWRATLLWSWKRRGFMMEQEPIFCDVIVRRYKFITGQPLEVDVPAK